MLDSPYNIKWQRFLLRCHLDEQRITNNDKLYVSLTTKI